MPSQVPVDILFEGHTPDAPDPHAIEREQEAAVGPDPWEQDAPEQAESVAPLDLPPLETAAPVEAVEWDTDLTPATPVDPVEWGTDRDTAAPVEPIEWVERASDLPPLQPVQIDAPTPSVDESRITRRGGPTVRETHWY